MPSHEKSTAGAGLAGGLKGRLGKGGVMALLVLCNMFVPLSLDMYLPALPSMSALLGVSRTVVNFTLSAFYVSYALSVFFWGALCDTYGRRRCLIAGAAFYAAGSVLCAAAPGVSVLIAGRLMQGVGVGGITGTSVAIVKDCFFGAERERMIARIYATSSIATIVVPVMGAQLLRIASWRAGFHLLGAVAAIVLFLSLLMEETQPKEEAEDSVFVSFKQYGALLRNRAYLIPLILFSVCNLPFMAYVALSSHIYVDVFGKSEQAYSLYFALGNSVMLLAPMLYIRFFSRKSKKWVGIGFFSLSALGGALIAAFGRQSAPVFFLAMLPFAMLYAGVYTFSVSLALEQVSGDTGKASSMINAISTVLGSTGTVLSSFLGGNVILGLGILVVAASLLPLLAWILFLRSGVPCKGLGAGAE